MVNVAKTDKTENVVRWILGGLVIIGIIVLIFVKLSRPDFPLKSVFIYSGILIVALSGIGIVYHFINKNSPIPAEEAKKLPPAMNNEEARKFAQNATINDTYADYIDEGYKETTKQLGTHVKSLVYTYRGKGKYEDRDYTIIFNKHYPHQTLSILIEPSENEIYRTEMLAASYPDKEPSIRETTTENPLLGTKSITREVLNDKDKEEKEKESKDI